MGAAWRNCAHVHAERWPTHATRDTYDSMTQSLDHHVLKTDTAGIAAAAGIVLRISEQVDPTVSGRLLRERAYNATLPVSTGIEARFVREGWLERAKKHFVHELEVGSATFDDAIYVVTSTRERTATFLANERVQQALLLLVDATRCVEVHGDRLSVLDDDAPDDGADALTELLALSLCALEPSVEHPY
jgi:hypothetical protein